MGVLSLPSWNFACRDVPQLRSLPKSSLHFETYFATAGSVFADSDSTLAAYSGS